MKKLIEICAESVESVLIAEKGGADRIELCSDLFEGGLTPTIGTFLISKEKSHIPLSVMIRPRGGDFCYSDIEFEVMKKEAEIFKNLGASSLVFGILTPDGDVDKDRVKSLIDIARPLPVTFHRAFDMTRDPFKALDDLIELKVDRVLTSGQEISVLEGLPTLKNLIEKAENKIIVMPGCGINERNFIRINDALDAKEYHMSLSSGVKTKMEYFPSHIHMGGSLRQSEFSLSRVSLDRLNAIRSLC